MNKTKELYSSPTTNLLVVRFEENIMSLAPAKGGIRNMTTTGGDVDDDSDGWI